MYKILWILFIIGLYFPYQKFSQIFHTPVQFVIHFRSFIFIFFFMTVDLSTLFYKIRRHETINCLKKFTFNHISQFVSSRNINPLIYLQNLISASNLSWFISIESNIFTKKGITASQVAFFYFIWSQNFLLSDLLICCPILISSILNKEVINIEVFSQHPLLYHSRFLVKRKFSTTTIKINSV